MNVIGMRLFSIDFFFPNIERPRNDNIKFYEFHWKQLLFENVFYDNLSEDFKYIHSNGSVV